MHITSKHLPIHLLPFLGKNANICLLRLSGHGLLGLYVVAQFFFNFGPNATTFIVAGECFPTRYRSTASGTSAAAGKIGSIIAQAAIAPLRVRGATKTSASPWLNHVLEIYALFMFLGIFTTLCIPETKRLTLERLSNEEPVESEAPYHETVTEVAEGKENHSAEAPSL